MTSQQMGVVVWKDDDLAGLYLDQLPIRDLRCQTPCDDVVVEHEVLGALEQRAQVPRGDLRGDAPGCGELRMQEDATLQTHDPQHVREGVHAFNLSPPCAGKRAPRRGSGPRRARPPASN